MKKFGFATIVATAFAAAIVGMAAPAEASTVADAASAASVGYSSGIDHHQWVQRNQQQVKTPPTPIVGNGR